MIRAPNANAYAERVIETIRAECLDRTLVLGRRHLDQTIRTYAEHYNCRRLSIAIAGGEPAVLVERFTMGFTWFDVASG